MEPLDKAERLILSGRAKLQRKLEEMEMLAKTFKELNRKYPRNSRFQMFTLCVSLDSKFKTGKLFGFISASDNYGLCPNGWCTLDEADDFGYVILFDADYVDPINICNGGFLHLGNPSSGHSVPVPFSSSLHMYMELSATNEEEDGCFHICNQQFYLDFKDFWDSEKESMCVTRLIGDEGNVVMNCLLLRDAVDASLEITLNSDTDDDLLVYGFIKAYYGGGFCYDCSDFYKGGYEAILLRPDSDSALKRGKIDLIRSELAVPTGRSLIIEAYLVDCKTEMLLMDDICSFPAQTGGSTDGLVKGKNCSFGLKVAWKYQA